VFAGAKDETFVRERMYASDLFVLASVTATDGDTEGAPVSLLEAQACGMPVVATRHAGIPEIVADGESGYLVREGDVIALTGALRQLLDQSQSWPEMGKRGRAFVQGQHDIRALNRRLIALYNEATARFVAPVRSDNTVGNTTPDGACVSNG
jgi:colanic acid/amylovoran biosynthesis glycosyltransferase